MIDYNSLLAKGGKVKVKKGTKKKRSYLKNDKVKKVEKSNKLCPGCLTIIALSSKNTIETSSGTKHYTCAIDKPMKRLRAIGLKPKRFSEPADFWQFLLDEAKKLAKQPLDKITELKLGTIVKIAEELFPGKSIVTRLHPNHKDED